jgi:protease IV
VIKYITKKNEIMKSFFKMVLASMVGFLLASVLFSMLTIIMLAAVIAMAPGEDYRVPSSSVLHIKLDVPIQDRGLKSPFEPVLGMQSLGLNQILKAMDRAATDDRIKGIYLDMGMLQGGMGTLEELREGLLKFAESGKPVIAYGEVVGQRSYYLATAADEIYLHPVGILDFSGLSAQLAFVKGLSEKMKVDMQVIRPTNNTYKSAVEPFLMDRMSEANREQTMRYLSSGWDHMLTGVSTRRGITSDQLNLIADSLSTFMPDGALRLGLVDGFTFLRSANRHPYWADGFTGRRKDRVGNHWKIHQGVRENRCLTQGKGQAGRANCYHLCFRQHRYGRRGRYGDQLRSHVGCDTQSQKG